MPPNQVRFYCDLYAFFSRFLTYSVSSAQNIDSFSSGSVPLVPLVYYFSINSKLSTVENAVRTIPFIIGILIDALSCLKLQLAPAVSVLPTFSPKYIASSPGVSGACSVTVSRNLWFSKSLIMLVFRKPFFL